MFPINESNLDRIIRVVVGLIMLALAFGGFVLGGLGLALKIIGILLLVTGVIGFCPLYALLKIRTNRA